MKALHLQDPEIITWWGTRTECVSAFNRKVRDGNITPLGLAWAYVLLHQLHNSWTEVQAIEDVRELADRLLETHPLSAADAFQLAAAMIWCDQLPQGREFVSLDARLWIAARAEGFTTLSVNYA